MIEQGWNEYRGWAKRARSLQAKTDRWNVWSMAALVATGALSAAAEFLGADPPGWIPVWLTDKEVVRALACAAAVVSALSLYVGRQALAVGAKSGWLRARATAEAIKSECFRFAGGVGDYAPDKSTDADAAAAFIERRKAIAARAAGNSLTPEDNSVGSTGDERRPSRGMADAWYIAKRIDGQIDFYRKGQETNEANYRKLQMASFAAGAVIAVVSAIAAVYGAQWAAWTGALTTLGAAVGAYGLAERQISRRELCGDEGQSRAAQGALCRRRRDVAVSCRRGRRPDGERARGLDRSDGQDHPPGAFVSARRLVVTVSKTARLGASYGGGTGAGNN